MRARAGDEGTGEDAVVVLTGGIVVLVALVAGVIGAALARDDTGVHRFFSAEAGLSDGLRGSDDASVASRPLTVSASPMRRLARSAASKPARAAANRPVRFARSGSRAVPLPPSWGTPLPTRPAVVSIYDDRTLRRGDAVMTERGIRIFAGARRFPLRPEDFRNVASARSLDVPFRKALIELERAPPSAFAG